MCIEQENNIGTICPRCSYLFHIVTSYINLLLGQTVVDLLSLVEQEQTAQRSDAIVKKGK